MELHGEDPLRGDCRSELAAIVSDTHDDRGVRRYRSIGVHEIVLIFLRHASEHGMRSCEAHRVPSDVRDTQRRAAGIPGREAFDPATQQAKSPRGPVFVTLLKQELKTETQA